jgi:menaquinone-dependent protoporphyrinogen oxidase
MEHLVLVAFATKYGSTEETARAVAAVLAAEGLAVEVCAVGEVKTWKPYSAVVLAAALYIGRLHKGARRFLSIWREELTRVPVALIAPGPLEADEKQRKSAQEQVDKELARVPWFHPVAQTVAVGKWDPAKLPFPFSWTLRNVPASDERDWNLVAAWAHEIAGKLQAPAVRPN